ncbi:hypothetical protein ACA910_008035 [Epithemia clementina (nom. ined.)]
MSTGTTTPTTTPSTTTTTTTTVNDSSLLTESFLYNEQPKLDAALKSFYSWLVASQFQVLQQLHPDHENDKDHEDMVERWWQSSRHPKVLVKDDPSKKHESVTLPNTTHWDSPLALRCTRSLSKAVNQHILPIHHATKASFRKPRNKNNKNDDDDENDQTSNNLQNEQEQEQQTRALVERVWNHHQATALSSTPSPLPTSTTTTTTTRSVNRLTQTLGRTSLQWGWSMELQEEAMTILLLETASSAGPFPPRAPAIAQPQPPQQQQQQQQQQQEQQRRAMKEFLYQFEQLLFANRYHNNNKNHHHHHHHHHGLDVLQEHAQWIWSTALDQEAELNRRAVARNAVAHARRQATTTTTSTDPPSLSQIPEEEPKESHGDNDD